MTERIPCPTCSGTGRMNIKVVDHDTREPTGERRIEQCFVCSGKGELLREIWQPFIETAGKAVDS